MELRYLADDAQAQPAPPCPSRFVGPVETIEEPWQVGGRHPCPIVFDAQFGPVRRIAGHDPKPGQAGGVSQRVVDQVLDEPAGLDRVGPDVLRRRQVQAERHAGGLPLRVKKIF